MCVVYINFNIEIVKYGRAEYRTMEALETDNRTAPYMLRNCDITIIDDLASNGMVLYHSFDSV